ncbi:MAG: imidazole glycerol phosphate synthase subunit HisH [Acidimicrobiia bacterium]|nr:imidazole glycerol phosphate synthase subunit HisH [Acidimicrobiia bacterium]
MSRIAVIDHGAGNLVSIAQGLRRAGADVTIVDHPGDWSGFSGVVLPGVGTTGAAMDRLDAHALSEPLREWGGPLLGICVGLQLFFDDSEEDGSHGLGFLRGSVRRLTDTPRLPHIGWNDVTTEPDPIFRGIPSGTPFYFVHSFAPAADDDGVVIGRTTYGATFTAAVRDGNRVGVQFHPERSGRAGLAVLGNFVDICEQADAA